MCIFELIKSIQIDSFSELKKSFPEMVGIFFYFFFRFYFFIKKMFIYLQNN